MSSTDQVCFDRLGFELLMDSLKETFGSAGESMIFQMSKTYGKHLIQSVSKNYEGSPSDDFVETIRNNLSNVNRLGWGSFTYELIDWEKGNFTVNVDENMFKDSCVEGRDSLCYFIRGVMVGTMEELSDRDLSIKETMCYKKGDEQCVFKMKPLSP